MWKWLNRRKTKPRAKETSLGEILIKLGRITREQLDEALMEQKIDRGNSTAIEGVSHYNSQKKRLLGELHDDAKITREFTTKAMSSLIAGEN